MFLLQWSGTELLWMALGAAAVVGVVIIVVPGGNRAARSTFTDDEITAYDDHLPRYFVFACVALVVGGVHMVVKNLPGFSQWLWEAGYGGHLFRDLANSHIIIVGGGTVILTGLTWYALPRMLGRPLFSEGLATASLWFTVIGVFGFYVAWLVLGLVEGSLVRDGMTYDAAKELVGAWHRIPTRATASIMGVGYWTYVLNVALTVWAGRRSRNDQKRLVKFLAVPAAALFVGTVQGVLQVLPASADWIHAAGKYGEYVDPISHAHINLVTGMVVALAGLLVFTRRHLGDGAPHRSSSTVFWMLTSSSLLFYLVFLLTGLILGGAVVGHGGIQATAVADFLRPRAAMFIAVAGISMFVAFWVYFGFVIRVVGSKLAQSRPASAHPAWFWGASTGALAIGTLHGVAQVIPATAGKLTAVEELPNVHAQLNMIAGVLMALIGTGIVILPSLLDRPFPLPHRRAALFGIGGGMAGYYAATMIEGLARAAHLSEGMDDGAAAAAVGPVPQLLMLAAAVVVLWGFSGFARGVWAVTAEYRAAWRRRYRLLPERITGPMPARLAATPVGLVVAMEFVGGLVGWPGPGWLYSGKAIPGVTLLLVGPSVAWALLPMLFSPYTDTALSVYGWRVLLVWLPATALLSAGALGIELMRMHRAHRSQQTDGLGTPQRAVVGT